MAIKLKGMTYLGVVGSGIKGQPKTEGGGNTWTHRASITSPLTADSVQIIVLNDNEK